MKNYKLLLLLLINGFSYSVVSAQTNGVPMDTLLAKEIRFLDAKLELTNVQKGKISDAFKSLHAHISGSVADTVKRSFIINQEEKIYEQSIRKILTGDQFTKYTALMDERKRKLETHRNSKPAKAVELKVKTN